MNSLRKWLFKPKKTDKALLAQFYFADEELNTIAAELDSFDSRKDPERCQTLVTQLRACQDKVLTIIQKMMDEAIPFCRTTRDFRVKFPDDVVQENLAGQLWFGAECLAAGSSIMNREMESASMRPLARALTKNLDSLRCILRDQCLMNSNEYSERIREALIIFDKLFAEFELSYVSAMVPVKSVKEYETIQEITVLFSETVIRAKQLGYITTDMIDEYDPALMFTIPRLAIVCGLLIYPDGPLNPDSHSWNMSDMFRPFQTLLYKIRELLYTLSEAELLTLERALCSQDEPAFLSTPRTPTASISTTTTGVQTDAFPLQKEDTESLNSCDNSDSIDGGEGFHDSASGGSTTGLDSTLVEVCNEPGVLSESVSCEAVCCHHTETGPGTDSVCRPKCLNKCDSSDSGLHSDGVSNSDSQYTISSSDSHQLFTQSALSSPVLSPSVESLPEDSDETKDSAHYQLYQSAVAEDYSEFAVNVHDTTKNSSDINQNSSELCGNSEEFSAPSDTTADSSDLGAASDASQASSDTLVGSFEASAGVSVITLTPETLEVEEEEESFYSASPGDSPLHQPYRNSPQTLPETDFSPFPIGDGEKAVSGSVDSPSSSHQFQRSEKFNPADDNSNKKEGNEENVKGTHARSCDKSVRNSHNSSNLNDVMAESETCTTRYEESTEDNDNTSDVSVENTAVSKSEANIHNSDGSNDVAVESEISTFRSEVTDSSDSIRGTGHGSLHELYGVLQAVQAVFLSGQSCSTDSSDTVTDSNINLSHSMSDSGTASDSTVDGTLQSATDSADEHRQIQRSSDCDSEHCDKEQNHQNKNRELENAEVLQAVENMWAADDGSASQSYNEDCEAFASSAARSLGAIVSASQSEVSEKAVEDSNTQSQCDRCTQTPHSAISNARSSKIHHHHSRQHSNPSSNTSLAGDSVSSKQSPASSKHSPASSKPPSAGSQSACDTCDNSPSKNIAKNKTHQVSPSKASHGSGEQTPSGSKTAARIAKVPKKKPVRVMPCASGSAQRLKQYADNWSDCSSGSDGEKEKGGNVCGETGGASSDSSGGEGSGSASDCEWDQESCSSSETSSYNSECHDDEEIALAVQAAELASRNHARARFRSSSDMIHRLFVCISGVADQLQTNFAGDLRNILRVVFNLNCSEPMVIEEEKTFRRPRQYGARSFYRRPDGGERNGVQNNANSSSAREPPAWIPDDQSTMCMSCKTPFTFVRRRHHCRNCGKIFCGRCSSNAVSLPHYGHSKPVRVCNRCFMFQVTPFTMQGQT